MAHIINLARMLLTQSNTWIVMRRVNSQTACPHQLISYTPKAKRPVANIGSAGGSGTGETADEIVKLAGPENKLVS